MSTDIGPSVIRTIVPLLVSLVAGLLTRKGIDPGPYSDLLAQVVGAAVGAAYYTAVRWLETHVRPRLGWLLGLPKAPTYDATAQADAGSPTGEVAAPASDIDTGTPVVTEAVDPIISSGGVEYPGRHGAV